MNPIVEKVRKLLALGESSNEHEASLALAKAMKLMGEYQLTQAYYDKMFPVRSNHRSGGGINTNKQAYQTGVGHGREINIRQAVGSSKGTSGLLN